MPHIMKLNDRIIGSGHPTFVIAEMSANHNQKFEDAVKIVKAAKDSGADAIKLQTYTPDTLTIKSDKKYFQIRGGTPWDGDTLYDLYTKTYTPWDWQPKLKAIAEELDLVFFSTPFDGTAVAFLEDLDIPCWKVASFELIDLPLIKKIAETQKPIIMSTGMANLDEIDDAVQAIRQTGSSEIALLKCTSAYPAPPDSMNLRTIPHLSQTYQVPTGLSDHTLGIAVPIAAVTLGASIIEKHFTLSKDISSPDSPFSLEPEEFKEMVKAIRTTEQALGEVKYDMSGHEQKSNIFRRSLFFVENIKQGQTITSKNIRSIRPGHGISPKYFNRVIGCRVNCNVEKGTPVTWDLLLENKRNSNN